MLGMVTAGDKNIA